MLKYNKYDVIFGEFPDRDGSIQSGYRPGIVIQNNIGNTYSPTLIAIPLTSKIKNLNQGTHMLIECNNENGLKVDSMLPNPKELIYSQPRLATSLLLHTLNKRWWKLTGSNCRPSACKTDALPAELNFQFISAY